MSAQGYIAIHRSLFDHNIWLKEKFSKGQAWVDLLGMASYKETEITIGSKTIKLKAGEFITSQVKLAQRWGWDRKTVRKFLMDSKNECMLDSKVDRNPQHGLIVISINNWNKFQGMDSKVDSNFPSKLPTINKSNNINKGSRYSKKEEITEEVFREIAGSYKVPVSLVADCWDTAKNWLEAKGRVQKNYKAFLSNWVKRESSNKFKNERIFSI